MEIKRVGSQSSVKGSPDWSTENVRIDPLFGATEQSRREAEKNWAAFQADPEWKKVKAESEAHGPLVDHIDRYFMDPTSYSALN